MGKQRFIFDLDGTLLKTDYSQEKEYFKSVLNYEDSKKFIPMIGKLLTEYEKTHERYDVLMLSKYLTEKTEINISTEIINGWKQALGEKDSVIVEGVIETLENLKSKNKSLVILTNWFLEPQIERIKRSNLKDYFEGIYGGEGWIKPNPQSYLRSCGKYPTKEAVIIGDSIENDVYGALKTGMDAIYYNPNSNNNFDKNKVKSIGSMKMIKEMY